MYAKFKSGVPSSGSPSVTTDKMAESLAATEFNSLSLTEDQSDKDCKPKSDIKKKKKVYRSSVVIIPPDDVWSQIQAIREKYDPSYKRWMPHINMLYPFFEDTGDNFEDAAIQLKENLGHIKSFKIVFSKDSFGYFRHKKYCTLWLKPLVEKNTDKDSVTTNESEPQHAAEALPVNTETAVTVDRENTKKLLTKQEKKAAAKQAAAKNRVVTSPYENHPAVVSLQSDLEKIFPACFDLSERSENGFYPHLSVGQFPPAEIDKFMAEFKENWNDIEFDLTELCMISREDFDDPFHVRHRIPFV